MVTLENRLKTLVRLRAQAAAQNKNVLADSYTPYIKELEKEIENRVTDEEWEELANSGLDKKSKEW